MRLLFVHGWGFDRSIWSQVAVLLPQWPAVLVDRGYFGAPRSDRTSGPVVAVTHSFGTMLVLRSPPLECRGLVAINGFDRFTARRGHPGIAPRAVNRMIEQFADNPEVVLHAFRRRCGTSAPFGSPRPLQLLRDLVALKDLDCTAEGAGGTFPIVSLQGDRDPILPAELRESVFLGAPHLVRARHEEAGHLLPLSHPSYCARTVAKFVERLA